MGLRLKIGNLEKTQHKAVTLILTHNGNTVIVNYVVIANLYRQKYVAGKNKKTTSNHPTIGEKNGKIRRANPARI